MSVRGRLFGLWFSSVSRRNRKAPTDPLEITVDAVYEIQLRVDAQDKEIADLRREIKELWRSKAIAT